MKRYVKANTVESPSAYLRNNFEHYDKGMQTYDIDGVQITTNFMAYKYAVYNGYSRPRGYENCTNVDYLGGNTSSAFDKLFSEGYTNIKFLEQTTSIRGFHRIFVAYKK